MDFKIIRLARVRFQFETPDTEEHTTCEVYKNWHLALEGANRTNNGNSEVYKDGELTPELRSKRSEMCRRRCLEDYNDVRIEV
jgi:hypothetical protein